MIKTQERWGLWKGRGHIQETAALSHACPAYVIFLPSPACVGAPAVNSTPVSFCNRDTWTLSPTCFLGASAACPTLQALLLRPCEYYKVFSAPTPDYKPLPFNQIWNNLSLNSFFAYNPLPDVFSDYIEASPYHKPGTRVGIGNAE